MATKQTGLARGDVRENLARDDQDLGLCYFVTIALQDALSIFCFENYQKTRSLILEKINAFAMESKPGKAKAGRVELAQLFSQEIENKLNLGNGACSLAEKNHAKILGEAIGNQQGVLAWCVMPNHAHVLLEFDAESAGMGLQDVVGTWKNSLPGMNWLAGFFSQATQDKKLIKQIQDEILANPAFLENWPWFGVGIAENRISEKENQEKTQDLQVVEIQPNSEFLHKTVLLNEAIELLNPKPGKVIVDATLGGGGHSEKLLEAGARVVGIDQDPAALSAATQRLARFKQQFSTVRGSFGDLLELLQIAGFSKVDGILADLGVSSPQLDQAERGFSFRNEGPLDMRMNPQAEFCAADLVNDWSEEEIARVLWEFGEERASRRIAKAIVQARVAKKITTTIELAQVVEKVVPRSGATHPATKTFQAIRIAVNRELDVLEEFLKAGTKALKPGGRFAVITFHSLEDRAVKNFFAHSSRAEIDRPEWPQARPNPDHSLNLVTKKPVAPSAQEIKENPRARSAKLRAAERISYEH